MATRSKKSVTPAATPVSSQETPGTPLSPTRLSRLQEKTDLQNLNDRLACYIDKVRQLETENSRLNREIETNSETITRQVDSLKLLYDTELSDARKLLDETHMEKAKLEIDTKRLWEENEELKQVLAKNKKELMLAQNELRFLDSRVIELQAKYNQGQADNKKITSDLSESEKELAKLKSLVNDLRKQLEEESLARVEVENNNQSLKEELSFKDTIYHQQMTETRNRKQVEITEIDSRLSQQYEAKLQEALQDLRDDYEGKMAENRIVVEKLYEQKIRNLQDATNKSSDTATATMVELRQTRTRIDGLNARLSDLESLNTSLALRNKELEKQLDMERDRHARDMAAAEGEMSKMREQMEEASQLYQDLMDIKLSLDVEISAYRKLLESEEARLKISPTGTPEVIRGVRQSSSRQSSVRATPIRLGKRKRTLLDETSESNQCEYQVSSSAKGDIQISEVCAEGRFVRLFNKSDKEISLSGWQLIRKSGDLETQFKFHRSVKIDGGATVTVWSSDVGQAHEPPSNIVMKSQKWFVGETMSTALMNSDSEEVARTERVRKQISSSVRRHREMAGGDLGDDFEGQPRDPEKCCIM